MTEKGAKYVVIHELLNPFSTCSVSHANPPTYNDRCPTLAAHLERLVAPSLRAIMVWRGYLAKEQKAAKART